MKKPPERGFRGNRDAAKYFNANAIVQVLSGMLDQMPAHFRRSDVVSRLGIKTDREVELVGDALYLLKQKRLISWNAAHSAWKNTTR